MSKVIGFRAALKFSNEELKNIDTVSQEKKEGALKELLISEDLGIEYEKLWLLHNPEFLIQHVENDQSILLNIASAFKVFKEEYIAERIDIGIEILKEYLKNKESSRL